MGRFTKGEIRFAMASTLPVMTAYLFLGMAFGLVLNQAGFSWLWALFMSLYVYSGTLQFLLVPLMAQGADVLQVALLSFFVSIRHLFYGFSFLEEFRRMGPVRYYMIHTLTDETYSVLTALKDRPELDRSRVMLLISFFDQMYWTMGTVGGALAGRAIPFDLAGIEFSMTALFTVVFVEQWLSTKNHLPALIGLGTSILFLVTVGPAQFLPPALVASAVLLILARKRGLIHG